MKFFCCFKNNKMNKDENEVNNILLKYPHINNDTEIPYFSLNGNIFIAKPCNIYDGDTFSAIFEYKNELIKYKCRCLGYDSPEMKPLLSNPNRKNEIELAHKAKDRLVELINKHKSKLIKIECFDFDKYGRLLVKIWNMVDEKCINDIMVEEGHGKAYFGQTKEKW
jgi:endonuclease YncB( thermonuclease family)